MFAEIAFAAAGIPTLKPGEAIVETPAPEGDALLVLLRERFGLDFPKGTRFRPTV